jgi:hypothetical protein
MGLKAVIESLDEVPESLHALYGKSEDGLFVLELDGIETHPGARALKNALDAERASRRRANNKAETLAAELERYRATGPDAARAAPARPEEIEGGTDEAKTTRGLDDGQVEALINSRLGRLQADFVAERRALEAARDSAAESARSARQSLAQEQLENRILRAAAEAGVRRAAMADVLARARELWQIEEDGTPLPIRDDTPVLAPDGESWLAPEQWLAALSREAEHLFEPNRGGAAPGALAERAGDVPVVDLNRANAIGENLEAIAHGKVRVVGTQS